MTIRVLVADDQWMVRAGREEFLQRMQGQVFQPVRRVAKMLFFPFQSGDNLIVHAMLAGRYQYVEPEFKRRVRDRETER